MPKVVAIAVSIVIFLLGIFHVLDRYLGELQGFEGSGQNRTRTEVDAGFLDLRIFELLLGEGTLSAEAYLQGAEFAESDNFAILSV